MRFLAALALVLAAAPPALPASAASIPELKQESGRLRSRLAQLRTEREEKVGPVTRKLEASRKSVADLEARMAQLDKDLQSMREGGLAAGDLEESRKVLEMTLLGKRIDLKHLEEKHRTETVPVDRWYEAELVRAQAELAAAEKRLADAEEAERRRLEKLRQEKLAAEKAERERQEKLQREREAAERERRREAAALAAAKKAPEPGTAPEEPPEAAPAPPPRIHDPLMPPGFEPPAPPPHLQGDALAAFLSLWTDACWFEFDPATDELRPPDALRTASAVVEKRRRDGADPGSWLSRMGLEALQDAHGACRAGPLPFALYHAGAQLHRAVLDHQSGRADFLSGIVWRAKGAYHVAVWARALPGCEKAGVPVPPDGAADPSYAVPFEEWLAANHAPTEKILEVQARLRGLSAGHPNLPIYRKILLERAELEKQPAPGGKPAAPAAGPEAPVPGAALPAAGAPALGAAAPNAPR